MATYLAGKNARFAIKRAADPDFIPIIGGTAFSKSVSVSNTTSETFDDVVNPTIPGSPTESYTFAELFAHDDPGQQAVRAAAATGETAQLRVRPNGKNNQGGWTVPGVFSPATYTANAAPGFQTDGFAFAPNGPKVAELADATAGVTAGYVI